MIHASPEEYPESLVVTAAKWLWHEQRAKQIWFKDAVLTPANVAGKNNPKMSHLQAQFACNELARRGLITQGIHVDAATGQQVIGYTINDGTAEEVAGWIALMRKQGILLFLEDWFGYRHRVWRTLALTFLLALVWSLTEHAVGSLWSKLSGH